MRVIGIAVVLIGCGAAACDGEVLGLAPDPTLVKFVLAAGALCTQGESDEFLSLTSPCTRGTDLSVRLWHLGSFDGSGKRDDDMVTSIGPETEGAEVVFDCVAHSETLVDEFEFGSARKSHMGFFDLTVQATVPVGVTGVCYALRVERGAAVDRVVWADGEFCTEQYGDGPTLLTYGDVAVAFDLDLTSH